jgi:hypothetical protein
MPVNKNWIELDKAKTGFGVKESSITSSGELIVWCQGSSLIRSPFKPKREKIIFINFE